MLMEKTLKPDGVCGEPDFVKNIGCFQMIFVLTENGKAVAAMAEYGIPDCVILFAMVTFVIWAVGFVWLN